MSSTCNRINTVVGDGIFLYKIWREGRNYGVKGKNVGIPDYRLR
jgi:hypothetical protein